MDQALGNMALSIVFSVLGFILLFLGFKVFDWLTPADLSKKIFEDGNMAAALVMAAFILALAQVVAAAIN